MRFIRQAATVEYMHRIFDIYVLHDDAEVEYRNGSNNLAFEKKRQVEASEGFRQFLVKYNPGGARDLDIRVEVDPYEDEGDGYTVRLLLAFPLDMTQINLGV